MGLNSAYHLPLVKAIEPNADSPLPPASELKAQVVAPFVKTELLE